MLRTAFKVEVVGCSSEQNKPEPGLFNPKGLPEWEKRIMRVGLCGWDDRNNPRPVHPGEQDDVDERRLVSAVSKLERMAERERLEAEEAVAFARKEQEEAEEAERLAEAEQEDVFVAEMHLDEAEKELEEVLRAQIKAGEATAMHSSFLFFDTYKAPESPHAVLHAAAFYKLSMLMREQHLCSRSTSVGPQRRERCNRPV